MDDPIFHKFRHKLYTTRVPIPDALGIDINGWKKEDFILEYGSIVLDEFRSVPDEKQFHYVHTNGDRLRFIESRLSYDKNTRFLSVALLNKSTKKEFTITLLLDKSYAVDKSC